MFYLTTHSTHFIYGYMASSILREETRCRHMGYSFRLAARVLLYAPSHMQDNTYHGLCYTSRGALAGRRNSSMGSTIKDRSDEPSHHERTLLPRSYVEKEEVQQNYQLYISVEIIIIIVYVFNTNNCVQPNPRAIC